MSNGIYGLTPEEIAEDDELLAEVEMSTALADDQVPEGYEFELPPETTAPRLPPAVGSAVPGSPQYPGVPGGETADEVEVSNLGVDPQAPSNLPPTEPAPGLGVAPSLGGAQLQAPTAAPSADQIIEGAKQVRELEEARRRVAAASADEVRARNVGSVVGGMVSTVFGPEMGTMIGAGTADAYKMRLAGYREIMQGATTELAGQLQANEALVGLEEDKQREADRYYDVLDKGFQKIDEGVNQAVEANIELTARIAAAQEKPEIAWDNAAWYEKGLAVLGSGMFRMLQMQSGRGIGGANPVLSAINRSIENDMGRHRSQLNSMLKKQSALGASADSLLRIKAAGMASEKAKHMQKLAGYIAKANAEIARANDPQLIGKYQKFIGATQNELGKLHQEYMAEIGSWAKLSAAEMARRAKLRGSGRGKPKAKAPVIGDTLYNVDTGESLDLSGFVGTSGDKEKLRLRWDGSNKTIDSLVRTLDLSRRVAGVNKISPTSKFANLLQTKDGARLRNAYLSTLQEMVKAVSGQQVTDKEFERFIQRLGQGVTVRDAESALLEEVERFVGQTADDVARLGPDSRIQEFSDSFRKHSIRRLARMKPGKTPDGSEMGSLSKKLKDDDPEVVLDSLAGFRTLASDDQFMVGKNAKANRKILVARVKQGVARLKKMHEDETDPAKKAAAQRRLRGARRHLAELMGFLGANPVRVRDIRQRTAQEREYDETSSINPPIP